jgi:hypothetical protein
VRRAARTRSGEAAILHRLDDQQVDERRSVTKLPSIILFLN